MDQHEQNQLVAALDELESQATKTAKAVEELVEQRNELLEVLETLSTAITVECELRGENPDYHHYSVMCRAAIAKAKGL